MTWIPVSERLPESNPTKAILITYFAADYRRIVCKSSYDDTRQLDSRWEYTFGRLGTVDVAAWMPMPEPYDP